MLGLFPSAYPPLYRACKEGAVQEVKELLKQSEIGVSAGPEIEVEPGPSGKSRFSYKFLTPFWIACRYGRTEIVSLLLKDPRVDISRTTWVDYDAVSIACYYGHVDVLQLLIQDCRLWPSHRENLRDSPLYIASLHGHSNIVRLLLTLPEVEVNQGHPLHSLTPIQSAIFHGQVFVVKELLTHPKIQVKPAWLEDESTRKYPEITKILAEHIAKKNLPNSQPIEAARSVPNLEMLQLLELD